ncbi:bifunctional nicotinamidase/pyrazinamidase [Gracilinema caldarium]|uniref:Nicotinamidase n=1 Tax=Gracilinema caldarium (strain ATCC 51460 / DSM 7334 / H1) TaxID=744872 RepID=F8F406_GRAC1|nr:bifunctional nicotinamidase/pyrazinamidase [Gracilinema caldarium]AEJ20025.1 Nicotinamidase [Gracilinema caldarium DSM 7334]
MAIDFAHAALLIIDVQNDFCPSYRTKDGTLSQPGALAVPGGNEIIPIINHLASKFDKHHAPIVATQDWHPQGHCSFASSPATAGGEQGMWPDHCVQGSWGAELHSELNQNPIRLMIRKGFRSYLDSYSAFFENDHITPTGLEGYLKNLEITSLYLTGLATDYCVKYSALDARRIGFTVSVISEAVRGVDYPADSIQQAMKEMKNAGVAFITLNELSF